jgi:hypothetical protein
MDVEETFGASRMDAAGILPKLEVLGGTNILVCARIAWNDCAAMNSVHLCRWWLTAITALCRGWPTLDHSQAIATTCERVAAKLIHQSSHQVNTASPDTHFSGTKLRDLLQVERLALVQQFDFHSVTVNSALNVERMIRLAPMGMANNVSDRFTCC